MLKKILGTRKLRNLNEKYNFQVRDNRLKKINKGYYTAAWKYEFYFRVVKTIFYERAQRVKHCFSPRESKIYILKPLSKFLLLYGQEGLPFFFLTPSANFIANCCISAAGISWSSLLSSSLEWNSLNNFQSYKSFLLGIKIILLLRERFYVSFR